MHFVGTSLSAARHTAQHAEVHTMHLHHTPAAKAQLQAPVSQYIAAQAAAQAAAHMLFVMPIYA